MRHNRKDKRNKHLAYTQTFADIFVPILFTCYFSNVIIRYRFISIS